MFGLLSVSANVYSQMTKLTFKAKQSSVEQIFEKISEISDFKFIYKNDEVNLSEKIDINAKNLNIEEVLNEVLDEQNVEYKIIDNKVIIFKESLNQSSKIEIKGKVTDSKGETLPGVNVMVKGSTNGMSTDANGEYTLKVSEDTKTIIFSFIGYSTQEISIAGRKIINVTMIDEATDLDEVVVTALGIKREKKALGYSVTELKSKDITETSESNVLNALTGKVAGVEITQPSGSSMGSSKIVLRGNSSIQGNNAALIVVDGVIFNNSANISDGVDRGQGIGDLNPEDIESVTVLKGANASALYGSRAQNGVLVITTKNKIKSKGIGLVYKSGVTIKEAYVWPDLQNVYGQGKTPVGKFAGIGDDGIPYIGGGTRDESWGPKMEGQDVRVHWLRDKPIRKYSPQPDNFKQPFRTGITTDQSLSLSYATDKATYYASLMYQNVNEYIETSEGEKAGGSLRVTQQITDKFSVDMKLAYTQVEATNRPVSNSGLGMIFLASGPRSYYDSDLRQVAYPYSGKDWSNRFKDGDPIAFATTEWTGNIYWGLHKDLNKDRRRRLVGSLKFNYDITKDLKAMVRHGFDQTEIDAHAVRALQSRWNVYEGRYNYLEQFTKNYTTDFLLSYNKTIMDGKINLSANLGGSQFRETSNSSKFVGEGFPTQEMLKMNYAEKKSYSYNEYEKTINSLYGTAQVGYDNMLYADVTYRNDWSSTLNSDNNSYGYYSATGSFIFSELLKDIDWLSFGKFRYSYAEVGNDTDAYVINRVYSSSVGNKGEISMSNPSKKPFWDLKPERTKSHELGLDLRLFKGRLNMDMTLYRANTQDQIIPGQPLSITSGYSSKLLNAGNVENKGIELMISGSPIKTKDFQWSIGLNYTKNESMVESMPDGIESIELNSANWGRVVVKEGNPFLTIEGYGYLRNDAGLIVVDAKGLPMRTQKYIELGNVEADWKGSVRNTFSYKGLTLGIQIDASIGGNIYSRNNIGYDEQGTSVASLNGREGWIASEEAREAAGVSSGSWKSTGGISDLFGKSVFYDSNLVNEDGVQVGGVLNAGEDAVYARPDKYMDNMSWNRGIAEYAIEDASFIKVREMSLSYSLPKSWVNKVKLQGVDFSIIGRNLFIIDKNTAHFDPDSYIQDTRGNGARGIDHSYYPSARTVSFSVKLKL